MDGRCIKIHQKVEIEVQFNGVKVKDNFLIINKSIINILIGRGMINKFEKRRIFPIKCPIETEKNKIVSWSRNIRCRQDMEDFNILVEQMEKDGKLEQSTSMWLNPVVLTRKKSGEMRFCLDLRRVNEIVELDGFELPKTQEILRTLNGKKYFTKLDLKDGFFQVKLDDKAKEKTAFIDGKGRLMQMNVIPQGFKNSAAIFQRGMQIILEGLVFKKCLVYIDDILIFGETKEELQENECLVRERLKRYNLEENVKKGKYMQENITFLGYNISLNKIKPTTERYEGIVNYPVPKTKKQLRGF